MGIFLIIFSEIIPFNGNKDNSFFINLFLEVIFSYSAIFQFKLLSKNCNYILILFLIINIIFNVIPFSKSINSRKSYLKLISIFLTISRNIICDLFLFRTTNNELEYIVILLIIFIITIIIFPILVLCIKSIISMMKDETNLKEIHVILEIFVFLYSNHLLQQLRFYFRDKHMIILDSKKTSNSLDHWYILYYNSLNKKYTRIDLFTKENDEKEIISYYKIKKDIKYEINYIQIIYIPFYQQGIVGQLGCEEKVEIICKKLISKYEYFYNLDNSCQEFATELTYKIGISWAFTSEIKHLPLLLFLLMQPFFYSVKYYNLINIK